MKRSVAGIVVSDGSYLVGRRKPGGALGGKWEFVGGKVDEGETPEAALRREFLEELGVEASVGKRLAVSSFEHAGQRYELQAYEAILAARGFVLAEHEEVRWVTGDELWRLDLADSDSSLLPLLFPPS